MISSLRFALALFVLLAAFTFAQAQGGKPGTRQSDSNREVGGRLALTPDPPPAITRTAESAPAIADPLLRVLVTRGILTTEEARAIGIGGSPIEQQDRFCCVRSRTVVTNRSSEARRFNSRYKARVGRATQNLWILQDQPHSRFVVSAGQ